MAGPGDGRKKNGKKTTSVFPPIFLVVVALFLFLLIAIPSTAERGQEDLSTTVPSDDEIRTDHALLPRSSHPKRSWHDRFWRKRVFNADAHEVPSGPNPISNR